MAAVLHVYKEVEIVNQGLVRGELREAPVITISYDEKPGVQALAPKSPDLPPVPGQHPSHTRDYEYERLGTVSLLAGLDLHTGRVTETVRDTHKSSDFIAFLQRLDASYPAGIPIRLLLDNHSAHISRESRPTCRRCRGVSGLYSPPRMVPGSTWSRPSSARWRGACCGASG